MEPIKQTFVDKVVSFASPQAGLRRLASKQRLTEFHYTAAQPSPHRKLATAAQHQNPSSYANDRDRQNLMYQARDAAENSPIVSGILDKLALYTTQRLAFQSRTGNPKIDQKYEDYFHGWAHQSADATGRFTFRKLVELAFVAMLRDGDCGLVLSSDDENTPQLSIIEADRIGDANKGGSMPRTDSISGVKLDENGRPVSYEVWKRSLTNQYQKDRDFSADQFIMLMQSDRADSYRGISYFHSVLSHVKDLQDLLAFEKSASKYASSYAGFVRSSNPYSNTGAGAFATKPTATTPGTMEAVAGKVVRLGESEDITFAPGTNRPSGGFMNLVSVIQAEIASGLGLPIGFVTDFSKFGGVSARIESQQVMRSIHRWQAMLEDTVLNRVKNLVISSGISKGESPPSRGWNKGAWQYASWLTADLGHEVNADLNLLRAGIKTRRQIVESQGGDFRETTEQLANEVVQMRDVSASTGVPIDLYIPDMVNATSMLAATETEPTEPTLGEKLGDKGVSNVIDLLEAVGNGIIDRESAIQMLVQTHDIPLQKAEKIVPKLDANPESNDQPISKEEEA